MLKDLVTNSLDGMMEIKSMLFEHLIKLIHLYDLLLNGSVIHLNQNVNMIVLPLSQGLTLRQWSEVIKNLNGMVNIGVELHIMEI